MEESYRSYERQVSATDRLQMTVRGFSEAEMVQAIELRAKIDIRSDMTAAIKSVQVVFTDGGEKVAALITGPSERTRQQQIEEFAAIQSLIHTVAESDEHHFIGVENQHDVTYVIIDPETIIEICPVVSEGNEWRIGMRTVRQEDVANFHQAVPLVLGIDDPRDRESKMVAAMKIVACVTEGLLPEVPQSSFFRAPQYSIPFFSHPGAPVHTYEMITKLVDDQHEKRYEATKEAQLSERKAKLNRLERSFEAIGGLAEVKERLQIIGALLIDPEAASAYNLKAPHFILYGPPGTGKTTLVHLFSEGVDAHFVSVRASEIDAMHYGESAKNVTDVIKQALKYKGNKPIIIYVDEIDALIGTRNDEQGHYRNIIKAFNVELDRLQIEYPNKVIIVGTTNADKTGLDPSVSRSGRFEALSVPLPTQQERSMIWGTLLASSLGERDAGQDLYGYDLDLQELASESDAMPGADFNKILEAARSEKYMEFLRTGTHTLISQSDILRHLRSLKRK